MQKLNPGLKLLNQLGYSVYMSRGAGLCLAINPALLLMPMCRHSITYLRNRIPIIGKFFPDFSIYFHKVCSYTLLFWSVIHTVCHYINFIGVEKILKINTAYNLHFKMTAGVTGHIMVVCLLIISAFSFKKIRMLKYELFWYTHHLFVIFYIAYILHGTGCFVKTDNGKCMPYYSSFVSAPVFLVYFLERVLREFRKEGRIVSVIYSGDTLKIKVPRNNMKYLPGHYILLKCGDISQGQWHPFTITSSPEEKDIEVSIRCLGDWTFKIRDLLLEKTSNNSELPLVKIDGPFGSPIDTICNYSAVILVASGIGITPYISMLKYIVKNDPESMTIKKIDLIWVNRDPRYFEWFNEEIKFFWENSCSLRINFHMYLTEHITTIPRIKSITTGRNVYLNKVYRTDIPINYGRPDFNKFFKRYLKSNTDLYVGCFVCGSKNLEINVRESCRYYSNKDVSFIFKAEKFS